MNDIALGEGFQLTSVMNAGFSGASDVHWITAFAEDGGDAILTADTDFLKLPPQVMAVQRTGVRIIHLPSSWANAKRALQAGHLLMWWRRIEVQLTVMKPRECFTMPFNVSEDAGMKRVPLDFQGIGKKAKKAGRRSSGR